MMNCSTYTPLLSIPLPLSSMYWNPLHADYLTTLPTKPSLTVQKENTRLLKTVVSHPHSSLRPTGQEKRTGKGTLFGLIHHIQQKCRMNIGKIFLKLVDKHFPKSNKLHKIFNRNTSKVSCSCAENMTQIYKETQQQNHVPIPQTNQQPLPVTV